MIKLLLVLFALFISGQVIAAPWSTIVVGRQTDPERLATVDLQRYLAQVTGKTPKLVDAKVWRAKPSPAVVLGTPATNPLLNSMRIDKKKLGAQGYHLANHTISGAQVVVAAGATVEGATNAVYGLLRELGYGFYLGSEAIPQSLPDKLPRSPVVKAPVFKMRGVLPWYNFFNSPTTWDPIDHRAFVDQLVRSGANFLGYHTYDHEPFAAYEENGKMVWGERLLNTKSPNWGTSSMLTSRFGGGTDKLFAQEYFGAASTEIAGRDLAIKAEQDIMRDALDYAHKRGLHTCLGFEMSGNPFNPTDREIFLKRINKVLDQYPSLDYLWIWQSETRGVTGLTLQYQTQTESKLDPDRLLSLCATSRRDVFKRVVDSASGEAYFFNTGEEGKMARATEAARLEQYAQLAQHALDHRKNAPKLVISGWGGDERLLSEEYYDGLDKLLSKDVVFSSLDHINPRPRVDKVYNELPADRQRWPIPWLENDGDQWHPQPYVHVYEGLVKDAHKGGSQGILGIHWRTRDVEENFGYLMHYSWNPGATAEDFFQDYARRCYSPEIADKMRDIHSRLDSLGVRWVGGAGQVECGSFGWGPGDEKKALELQKIRDEATVLLPKAGSSSPRLKWLLAGMDWSLQYRKAELSAVEAGKMLAQARGEASKESRLTARKALNALEQGDLEAALRTYAERVTTRGEYGVLATINAKAYAAWQRLQDECAVAAGYPDYAKDMEKYTNTWKSKPQILLPRLITSAPARQELQLSPVVLGGEPAWLHYRTVGERPWRSLQLQDDKGWVKRASIPAPDVAAPGIEFGFSFDAEPGEPMAYSPVAMTVMPATNVDKTPAPIKQPGKAKPIRLSVKEGKVIPLELHWSDLQDADFYRVYRDGEAIAETAVCMLPDCPPRVKGEYYVEALRGGKVIANSKSVSYVAPERKVEETFKVDARVVNAGVQLSWPSPRSLYVTSYKVTRVPAGGGEAVNLKPEAARRDGSHVRIDTPPAGRWKYSVTPLSLTGSNGVPVEVTVDFAPGTAATPSLDLPLTVEPQGAQVVGIIRFDESGAYLGKGHIVLPHKDTMDLGLGMTLEFEFKADDTSTMPVLLSHGSWQMDGWFVQILGGNLVLRAARGDARGPRIEPGKWYKIKILYDGSHFSVWANGQPIGQDGHLIADVPAKKNLIIGQYDQPGTDYAFHGVIRNVRLYNEPLK